MSGSASSRRTYDTDSLTFRRLFAFNPETNQPFSTGLVLAADSNTIVSFQNPLDILSSYGQNIGFLPSTFSTFYGSFVSTSALTSTVAGLGTASYVSSPSLASTTSNIFNTTTQLYIYISSLSNFILNNSNVTVYGTGLSTFTGLPLVSTVSTTTTLSNIDVNLFQLNTDAFAEVSKDFKRTLFLNFEYDLVNSSNQFSTPAAIIEYVRFGYPSGYIDANVWNLGTEPNTRSYTNLFRWPTVSSGISSIEVNLTLIPGSDSNTGYGYEAINVNQSTVFAQMQTGLPGGNPFEDYLVLFASTLALSTGQITTSTLYLMDGITGNSNLLNTSNNNLFFNGAPLETSLIFQNFITSTLTTSTLTVETTAILQPFDPEIWVAAGLSNATYPSSIIISQDKGLSWTGTKAVFDPQANGVAWNGFQWVAVGAPDPASAPGTGAILYSYDGITWSNTTGGFEAIGAGNPQGTAIAWNGHMWVAGGIDDLSANTLKYSYDGISWSNSAGIGFQSNFYGGPVYGVAWNGYQWLAVGTDTRAEPLSIQISADGINWTSTISYNFNSVPVAVRGVAWGGRFWVAVGGGNTPLRTIEISEDGLQWRNIQSGGFTTTGRGVAWNGAQWVAVGEAGPTSNHSIQYSTDGSNWLPATSGGFDIHGSQIAWGKDRWIAVGEASNSNSVRYSFDGKVWQTPADSNNTSLFGIAYTSNAFPTIQTNNLNFYMEKLPNFFKSTNQIIATASSLVINNTLTVLKDGHSVGINTEAPNYTLDVQGSIYGSSLIVRDTTILNNVFLSSFTSTDANISTLFVSSLTADFASTGQFIASTIFADAIGVGTVPNSTFMLDVAGNALIRGSLSIGTATTTLTTSNIRTSNIDAVFISTATATFSSLTFIDINTGATVDLNFSNGEIIVGSTIAIIGPNLFSTVEGLGTAGYVSSLSLVSTLEGLGQAGYVSSLSLASTVEGLGTARYVSSLSLASSITGLATAGYLSSAATLVSTPFYNTTLTSTVRGLGTTGYLSSLINIVSTPFLNTTLQSTLTGLGTARYLSSAANLVSTPFLGTVLGSTLTGLGTAGYLSSAATLVSTPFLNTALTSTVRGLGTTGYLSSLINIVSTPFLNTTLTSTVRGLGTTGYLSSLINVVSTPFLNTALTSTVRGLGTVGYVSTQSLVSTVEGLGTFRYVSTLSLASSIVGLGTAGYLSSLIDIVSTPFLDTTFQSTVQGLGTAGYLSSLIDIVSTPFLDTTFQSTIEGLGTAGYLSTAPSLLDLVSTPFLDMTFQSTIEGLGTAGYLSTAPSLLDLVSTPFLDTTFQSTIEGLGTAGYLSTGGGGGISDAQLTSTTQGLGTLGYLSTVGGVATFAELAVSSLSGGVLKVERVAIGSSTDNPFFALDVSGGMNVDYVQTTSIFTLSKESTISIEGTISQYQNPTIGYPYAAVGKATSQVSSIQINDYFGNPFPESLIAIVAGGFDGNTGNGITWAGDRYLAVGIASNSNDTIQWSQDGLNWFATAGVGFSNGGEGIFSYRGAFNFAVGDDPNPLNTILFAQDNPPTWQAANSGGFSVKGYDIFYNGRLAIAVGDDAAQSNTVQYSLNNVDWTGVTQVNWTFGLGIKWNGVYWLAVGVPSSSNPLTSIQYSENGIIWSNIISGGFDIKGQGLDWNGSMWMAVGASTDSNSNIQYSFDGFHWQAVASVNFTDSVNDIVWDGPKNRWIAAGADSNSPLNTVQFTTDNGSNWTSLSEGGFDDGIGTYAAYGISVYKVEQADLTLGTQTVNNVNAAGRLHLTATQNAPILFSYDPGYLPSGSYIAPTIVALNSTIMMNDTFRVSRGQVAINKTTPEATLDVAGSIAANYISSQQFFVSTIYADTMGIGTLPSSGLALDVNGNALIRGTLSVGTGTTVITNNSIFTGLISAGTVQISSIGFIDEATGLLSNVVLSNGQLFGPAGPLGGGISAGELTSTIEGLGTFGYISTPTSGTLLDLVSTPFLDTTFQSTIEGLGTAGYTSSPAGATFLGSTNFLSTGSAFMDFAYIQSTMNIQDQALGGSQPLFQSTTFLYFGSYVIGGARVANVQTITF